MSIDERHTNPITNDPQILILKNKLNDSDLIFVIREMIFIKPYPPSFSKMPASTIEPLTGASTWALGNHK